ncbi:hypothetical protein N7G274_003708 [Stereocaulon virgatum]|uniref:Uncharacterized protein n=1 Tax=Stereocaulon virgatum TaxID=373712 RepID=A0ABR4AC19_9LECA
MQNEELERLMANTSELRKQEKRQKSMESKVLWNELDEPETFQEQDERDMGELQRRGQEELVEPELLSPSKPDRGRIDAGPSTTVLPAQQCSTEAVQRGVTETSDSAPKDVNSSAQERGRQHGESQANGQDGNLMKENYEPEAQERGQEHEEQEWNEYRMEDSGQEERVHEGEVLDKEHNDTAGGDKQANEAQEVTMEDEAYREVQGAGVRQDEERQGRKHRVLSGENDEGAALRAQQLQEGRKPMEKGKYQRLNRFKSSNNDTNEEDGMSVDDTGGAVFYKEKGCKITPGSYRKTGSASTKKVEAVPAEFTDTSMGITFTFKPPQAPSQST